MAYITLLNGVLNFGFPILFKKWGKKDETILRKKKKQKKNENIATIVISVDGKGTVFPIS